MSTVDASGAIHGSDGRFAGHVAGEPASSVALAEPPEPTVREAEIKAVLDRIHTTVQARVQSLYAAHEAAGGHVDIDTVAGGEHVRWTDADGNLWRQTTPADPDAFDDYDTGLPVETFGQQPTAWIMRDGTVVRQETDQRTGALMPFITNAAEGGTHTRYLASNADEFTDADGKFHRSGGKAAWISADSVEWYEHGVPHRDRSDGPQQIDADGQCSYYEQGQYIPATDLAPDLLARHGVRLDPHDGNLYVEAVADDPDCDLMNVYTEGNL